ncbi:MAG TPA: hypothetical protein VF092_09475 [Longimicrobium sp.]
MPARPRPRIRPGALTPGPEATRPDFASLSILPPEETATRRKRVAADQRIGGVTLAKQARGILFNAEAMELYSSDEFPDGFHWVQTVTTNSPDNPETTSGGAAWVSPPVTYVDPPKDDDRPFYYKEAQEAEFGSQFQDSPVREVDGGGREIQWEATLSLCGVKGKAVTILDSITYGFMLDYSAKVTVYGPAPAGDIGSHLTALRSEFPSWTFR